MTAKQLHDAIGLLPADLVAEADALRQSRPLRRSRWQHYAAMAACFALVLGCTLSVRLGMTGKMSRSEAVMEAAPAEIPALQAPEAEADSSAVTAAGTTRDTDNGQSMDSADATALLETAAASETPEILCIPTPANLSGTKCYASGPKITLVSSREELEAYRTKWEGAYLLDELTAAWEAFDESWFEAHDLVLIPVDAASVAVTEILSQDGTLEVHLAVTHSDAATSWLVLAEPEKGTVSSPEDVRLVFTENGE